MKVNFRNALKKQKVLFMLLLLMFLGSSFALSGCATVLGGGAPGRVSIKTTPENVKVSKNYRFYGKTPTSFKLNGTSTDTLLFQKNGYEDAQLRVRHEFNTIGILNILIWPGFLIDYFDGAMFKMKRTAQVCYGKLSLDNCNAYIIKNGQIDITMKR